MTSDVRSVILTSSSQRLGRDGQELQAPGLVVRKEPNGRVIRSIRVGSELLIDIAHVLRSEHSSMAWVKVVEEVDTEIVPVGWMALVKNTLSDQFEPTDGRSLLEAKAPDNVAPVATDGLDYYQPLVSLPDSYLNPDIPSYLLLARLMFGAMLNSHGLNDPRWLSPYSIPNEMEPMAESVEVLTDMFDGIPECSEIIQYLARLNTVLMNSFPGISVQVSRWAMELNSLKLEIPRLASSTPGSEFNTYCRLRGGPFLLVTPGQSHPFYWVTGYGTRPEWPVIIAHTLPWKSQDHVYFRDITTMWSRGSIHEKLYLKPPLSTSLIVRMVKYDYTEE